MKTAEINPTLDKVTTNYKSRKVIYKNRQGITAGYKK